MKKCNNEKLKEWKNEKLRNSWNWKNERMRDWEILEIEKLKEWENEKFLKLKNWKNERMKEWENEEGDSYIIIYIACGEYGGSGVAGEGDHQQFAGGGLG